GEGGGEGLGVADLAAAAAAAIVAVAGEALATHADDVAREAFPVLPAGNASVAGADGRGRAAVERGEAVADLARALVADHAAAALRRRCAGRALVDGVAHLAAAAVAAVVAVAARA